MMHKTWFSKKILWTEWTQKFNQKGLAWGCLMTPFLKISNNYKGSIYRTISIQILQKSLYPETPCHKNNAETPKIHRKLLKTKRPKKKQKKPLWGVEERLLRPRKILNITQLKNWKGKSSEQTSLTLGSMWATFKTLWHSIILVL